MFLVGLILLSVGASAQEPGPGLCVSLRRWVRSGEGLESTLAPLRAEAADPSCRGPQADARGAMEFLDAWQASREGAFVRAARAKLACLRSPGVSAAARTLSALSRGAQVLDSGADRDAARELAGRLRREPAKSAAERASRAQGLLDLYEAAFEPDLLDEAVALGGTLAREARVLAAADDEAAGAGAMALLRLSWITDGREYRRAAKTLLDKHPRRARAPALLCAAAFAEAKPLQIVLTAEGEDDPGLREMLRLVHSRYRPDHILLVVTGEEGRRRLARHLPFVRGARPIGGKATAYVCRDYACKLPTSELSILAEQLGN